MTIKILGTLTLAAAAVATTVFGTSEGTNAHTSALPISCGFEVAEGVFGQTLRGNVTANEDITGRFEISFQKSGANTANIQQSGRFSLDAGETQTLGQASLGGSGSAAAELTLTLSLSHI